MRSKSWFGLALEVSVTAWDLPRGSRHSGAFPVMASLPPRLGLAPRLHARVLKIPKSLLGKEIWVYRVTCGVEVVPGP